jgi:hypothetical protein
MDNGAFLYIFIQVSKARGYACEAESLMEASEHFQLRIIYQMRLAADIKTGTSTYG